MDEISGRPGPEFLDLSVGAMVAETDAARLDLADSVGLVPAHQESGGSELRIEQRLALHVGPTRDQESRRIELRSGQPRIVSWWDHIHAWWDHIHTWEASYP